MAYQVIGGSYSVFDFNNFSGGATTRLWTTKADAVLEASMQSGYKLYFNYKGEKVVKFEQKIDKINNIEFIYLKKGQKIYL